MRRFIPFVFLVALLCVGADFGAPAQAASPNVTPSSASTPASASPGTGSPPAAEASSTVDVIKVSGVIDAPMADYLKGSVEDSEAAGSTVVIQLNSPGSLGIDGPVLAQRIHEATVPVIVWVGPAPAHAAGTAFLLTQAASLASMAPGAGLGPAEPLDLSDPSQDTGLAPASYVEHWTTSPDGQVTGDCSGAPSCPPRVLPKTELSAAEALRGNWIADLDPGKPTPGSVADLLTEADGKTVQTAAGPVVLNTANATIRYHDLGPARRVLHAVASPVAIYVLLVLGFAGVAFEITQPGFGFAGICGVIALGLAAYGLWVVPPNWFGFALLAGGTGLLIADVVLRKLGVLSAIGLVAFAAGTWLIYRGVAPAIDIPPALMICTVVAAFLYYGFGLTVAQQARDRIASTQKGLVGLVGETRGELDPEGAVHVKGTLWRGRSVEGPIPAGTKVRVRGVDGLVLRVEPEVEEEGD